MSLGQTSWTVTWSSPASQCSRYACRALRTSAGGELDQTPAAIAATTNGDSGTGRSHQLATSVHGPVKPPQRRSAAAAQGQTQVVASDSAIPPWAMSHSSTVHRAPPSVPLALRAPPVLRPSRRAPWARQHQRRPMSCVRAAGCEPSPHAEGCRPRDARVLRCEVPIM